MKILDLHNKLEFRRAISPVSVGDNTAQVSQIIDRQGFSGLEFVLALGSIADADATFTVLVEHGDASDLTGGAAVDDVDLLGTEILAGFKFDSDDSTRKIGYAGNKRYVRLTVTPASNASAALVSAIAVLGGAADAPTV